MNFKHFYQFLVFSGIIYWEIYSKQQWTCARLLLPRGNFAFCSHGEKLPWQGRLPGVVQRVIHLSKLPRGKEKFMWTVTDVRPCTQAKLTLGSVSCPEAMSCPGIIWTGPKRLFPASRGKVQEDKRKWNLPPAGNGPHSSDGEILTSKPTFIQGVSEKLLKKRGTEIASCAHIYMAF